MEQRAVEHRAKYAADAEALAVLDQLAQEREMHRRHSDDYAYEFFVARSDGRSSLHPVGSTDLESES
jgi:hypothetical protein